MKKTTLIILIIIMLGVVIGVVWYFSQRKSDSSPKGQYVPPHSIEGESKDITIMKDDFSIKIPQGWRETAPQAGVSLMVVNVEEEITDSVAKKVNFKSYYSVGYDTKQGKTNEEYMAYTKQVLQQVAPGIVITSEDATIINANNAYIMEAEVVQQGANYKIMIALIQGENDDVWSVSFNTPKSMWNSYQGLFYNILNSFTLR